MGAMVILLGIAVLFQFIIVRIKWNRGNYADVVVDLGLLFVLNVFFGSTILGVVSATAGSTLISLYLIWFPIKLFEGTNPLSDLYSEVAGTPVQPVKEQQEQQEQPQPAAKKETPTNFAKRFDNLFT